MAGRYEDYDTFGDTFVWKANALLEISEAFSIRGTIGTGFHAPSPGQNNTQIVTTNFRSGNQVQTGTYPDRITASPTNPIYALTDSLADGQIYPRSGGPFGTNRGFYYVRLRVTY